MAITVKWVKYWRRDQNCRHVHLLFAGLNWQVSSFIVYPAISSMFHKMRKQQIFIKLSAIYHDPVSEKNPCSLCGAEESFSPLMKTALVTYVTQYQYELSSRGLCRSIRRDRVRASSQHVRLIALILADGMWRSRRGTLMRRAIMNWAKRYTTEI